MGGFAPPPPGTRMCGYRVVWNGDGKVGQPRPCKRPAKDDSDYCGLHGQMAAKVPHIDVRDGGFCSWCGQPARSYVCDGVTIALCARHGKALERALREGR